MPPPGLRLGSHGLEQICWRSSRRLARPLTGAARPPIRSAATVAGRPRFQENYFVSNGLLDRFRGSSFASAAPTGAARPDAGSPPTSSPAAPAPDLPHRRRQAARKTAAAQAAAPSDAVDLPSDAPDLPTNASSILTEVAASHRPDSLRRHVSAFLSLAKPRLTVLVVLTAVAPYALYPVPSILSATALAADAPSLSPLTLLFLTAGTTLSSAAANALNMLYEQASDAKMSRTRNRPLVRALVSRRAALLFALAAATAGVAALYVGVNPTVAFLGAANIVLYAGVYTPLKRLSTINTWVGALVGGIPPLMGWAAAAGECASGDGTWRELLFAAPSSSSSSASASAAAAGGWLFAALLFAWQFPHFMALSWGVRHEYRAAGLRILAWVHPARNARVALRYSLAFVPWCVALCAAGVTEWSFAVTSLPVNVWLVREAVRFWRHEGHAGSARGLFWASVWYLPAILVLALLQKKGMWGRVWRSLTGAADLDDEWEDADEAPVVVPVQGKGS